MTETTSADLELRLLRSILRLILVVACITAPIFVFGEGFEMKYVWRVALSNGICVLLCWSLLRALHAGRRQLVARALVFGLLALVGSLAWFNGERVHVNVVNFVLITVLASAVAGRRVLQIVAAVSIVEMVAIAWSRPFPELDQDVAEARFEAIVQFLPTYLVIATVLWLRAAPSPPADEASASRDRSAIR